jgi:hypothetical protein
MTLTWPSTLITPTSITHEDPGRPHYAIVDVPTSGKKRLGRLGFVPATMGRDYQKLLSFFQKPDDVTEVRAWWG